MEQSNNVIAALAQASTSRTNMQAIRSDGKTHPPISPVKTQEDPDAASLSSGQKWLAFWMVSYPYILAGVILVVTCLKDHPGS